MGMPQVVVLGDKSFLILPHFLLGGITLRARNSHPRRPDLPPGNQAAKPLHHKAPQSLKQIKARIGAVLLQNHCALQSLNIYCVKRS